MIFGYESLLMKFRENSEEKVKSAVIGTWYGNTLMVLGITLFIILFMSCIISNMMVFNVLYLIFFISIYIYISTRRASLGITKNNFVYIRFSHLFYKPKEVYEIQFDNIKDIKLKRFFCITNVVMTFISNDKKFRRVKFKFSSFVFGMLEQKKTSKEIYDKLKELQKVIDRGDF